MEPRNEGFARLDERKRLPLGRYTDLAAGCYYRVFREVDGTLILSPETVEV